MMQQGADAPGAGNLPDANGTNIPAAPRISHVRGRRTKAHRQERSVPKRQALPRASRPGNTGKTRTIVTAENKSRADAASWRREITSDGGDGTGSPNTSSTMEEREPSQLEGSSAHDGDLASTVKGRNRLQVCRAATRGTERLVNDSGSGQGSATFSSMAGNERVHRWHNTATRPGDAREVLDAEDASVLAAAGEQQFWNEPADVRDKWLNEMKASQNMGRRGWDKPRSGGVDYFIVDSVAPRIQFLGRMLSIGTAIWC